MGKAGRSGEGEHQTERERERPRETQAETDRDRQKERRKEAETEKEPTWTRRGRQRPLEWVAEVPPKSQHPLCPETHRDQGCPPVPKLGQQLVCQVHTFLDTCADLHGQGHVQHLQEWLWSARPKVRQGRRGHCGAYLVHAADNLLELGRAVHEGTAPTLGETGSWNEEM